MIDKIMIESYFDLGWKLTAIQRGQKSPSAANWNHLNNALKSIDDLQEGKGVGLLHAYSGTMALDIDDINTTNKLFNDVGINLGNLLNASDAVMISSGRNDRIKLLYKMPFGTTRKTKKIIHEGVTAYELRCATANGLTMQDVLPPSIHPSGSSYKWVGNGHYSRLPLVPPQILRLWEDKMNEGEAPSSNVHPSDNATWAEIHAAMSAIPADCSREEWITVGMAIHHHAHWINEVDYGFELWKKWSQSCNAKYPGDREIWNQWASFRSNRQPAITLASLFSTAYERGYTPTPRDASKLFSSVECEQMAGPEAVLEASRARIPKLNLQLIPRILATRAQEISNSVGCDPVVPLYAGLAAVAAVIDSRSRLELMEGFKVPPVLWLMTVGDPADKKSPGSRPMMGILNTLEIEALPKYKLDLLRWEGEEAVYAQTRKAFLNYMSMPEGLLAPECAPPVHQLRDQPVPLKIVVNDITSQKLVRQLSVHPKGLLCYLDEMNGWIRKLGDVRSGEDRSTWVVAYEGESYEVDRVGGGTIRCENLAVSIYGNVQPRVLRLALNSLGNDGLLQRFVPAVLHPDFTRLGYPISDELSNKIEWESLIRCIHALPITKYTLSNDAYKSYRIFQQQYEHTKKDYRLLGLSDLFMTAFGKVEGLAGRIALIFHIIESPALNVVSVETMNNAIEFVMTYIVPTYDYLFNTFSDVNNNLDTKLIEFIVRISDHSTVSLAEIKTALKTYLTANELTDKANQLLCAAMIQLEGINWVKRVDDRRNESRGIASWIINPTLSNAFAQARNKTAEAYARRSKVLNKGVAL